MNTADSKPELDVLLAATSYLMTRYSLQSAKNPMTYDTGKLAESICQHLALLLKQPEVQGSRVFRTAYHSLAYEWEHILVQHRLNATGSHEQPAKESTSSAINQTSLMAPASQRLH
ncbi:MAG: hypothetical protein KDI15_08820 [Thiothrix sp.]|nr:hypothetical protein [Thiothrix sp.]HPE58758.1 hypothetical protein [Thiolinea sp.]